MPVFPDTAFVKIDSPMRISEKPMEIPRPDEPIAPPPGPEFPRPEHHPSEIPRPEIPRPEIPQPDAPPSHPAEVPPDESPTPVRPQPELPPDGPYTPPAPPPEFPDFPPPSPEAVHTGCHVATGTAKSECATAHHSACDLTRPIVSSLFVGFFGQTIMRSANQTRPGTFIQTI